MAQASDRNEPSSSPWGLRLREMRIHAGLTQEQLADAAGTTKATISKMERSVKRPSYEWAARLAPALAVDISKILGLSPLAERIGRLVPIIGLISAGNWREAIQEPDGFVPIAGGHDFTFALRVSGDSVDRVAPSGSYVAIDPTQSTDLVDGAFYAIQNSDGESTLKRFRRNPDRLEPDSSNPVHQPIILGASPVTIIGRATYIGREI